MGDWEDITLGQLFSVDNSKLGAHTDEPTVMSLSKYDGFVRADDYFGKRIASEKLDAYKTVKPGEWAYSTIHIDEGSIARNNLGETGVISPMYTTLLWRGEVAILPEYAELIVRSPRMLAEYANKAQGSVNRRRSLPFKSFSTIPIAVPPLRVQERVLKIIGSVDDQIAALAVEADVLDDLWWALGREMAAVFADDGTVPLASFCDISGGLTKNKKDLEQPDLVEVPYLRVANVYRHQLNLSEVATIKTSQAKAEKLRLYPGDVLMNEGGDKDKLGRGHVWEDQIPDCIHQNHVFRVRVTDRRFDPYFVSAWGNTFGREWFETFGTQTTGIASINRATLNRFPVPDVPLSVQQDWAERLRAVVETMDSLRGEADSLRATRASLLSGLLDRTINIESAELEGV